MNEFLSALGQWDQLPGWTRCSVQVVEQEEELGFVVTPPIVMRKSVCCCLSLGARMMSNKLSDVAETNGIAPSRVPPAGRVHQIIESRPAWDALAYWAA